jgi:hypothetical protein
MAKIKPVLPFSSTTFWKVLHPSRNARSAAFSTPPAIEVWIPIRREVVVGGLSGAGHFSGSFSDGQNSAISKF